MSRKYRRRRALHRRWNARRILEGIRDLFDADDDDRVELASTAWERERHERHRVAFYFEHDRPPMDADEFAEWIRESEIRSLPDAGIGWIFMVDGGRKAPARQPYFL